MRQEGLEMEILDISTDVLIVGGGLAGANAAMAAAERGAQVVVADKGKIERSGDIGGGVDHFLAYLNDNEEWHRTPRHPGIRLLRGTQGQH
jgi:succinate dehydrogenase/fumarate reductase flavoprotein subunit